MAHFHKGISAFQRPKSQFDCLVGLRDSDDRVKSIIDAMESIEADYEILPGVLPKAEYQELDNAVLGQLLRTLNPEELKRSAGDVFGRIYEYFLTQFADLKAHDNGEFFTPFEARKNSLWNGREITRMHKTADAARQMLIEQLKRVRYFHKQAVWLTERFPEGDLRGVEGLVKLVDRAELEANDWSLTPDRYVGVAPEEEDDAFDFEEALREIHIEFEGLNAEAAELAARISKNFKELGI
jgi:type I restriction-modification system DNA methylase subunit